MFGRQQWTLFADQVRLSELFRGKIFVLILGPIFFCTILTPSKIQASVSPFSRLMDIINRVGTGCAMDYAGKYTVDVFSIV
jgi:hypothetical protein